ncbi:MAG TPA: sigma-70 family RNA polymerase sigma factor [Polyangia bacterium]
MPESPRQSGQSGDDRPERPLSPEVTDIFVANHRNFLAFLERRVGNRAAAEDILQEAFVRGMSSLPTASLDNGEESVVAWFYRTLRNAAIDHHRRQHSAAKGLEAFAADAERETEPDAEMQAAVCQCIGELADTLKPEFAAAIKRIELDGVAVKDYANEAGISSSNAAVRVFRAREALRKQVARSCGSCAEHGCLDCTCSKSHKGCGS